MFFASNIAMRKSQSPDKLLIELYSQISNGDCKIKGKFVPQTCKICILNAISRSCAEQNTIERSRNLHINIAKFHAKQHLVLLNLAGKGQAKRRVMKRSVIQRLIISGSYV